MEGAGGGVGEVGDEMTDPDELNRRAAERAHDRNNELLNLFNTNADSHGQSAVKILLAMNGAAAVALLAFAGGLSAKFSPAQLEPLIRTLMWFVWGVVLAGIAETFAYLSQLCYAGARHNAELNWTHPYVHNKTRSKWWYRVGVVVHMIAFVSAIIGLGIFIYGMYRVQRAVLAII